MKCKYAARRTAKGPSLQDDKGLREILDAFTRPSWRALYRGVHEQQVWRQMWFAEARKRQVEAP